MQHSSSTPRASSCTLAAAIMGIGLSLILGCSREVRRFPLQPPMWSDPDQHPLEGTPGKYYSGIRADAIDKYLLYPPSRALRFEQGGEATNVNALDEVPNSSWFQNRIGWFDYTPERIAQAECGDIPNLSSEQGKWTIVNAKPDGANPGFFIEAPDGYRYLLKFDGKNQPLRATAADVVGSKLYWAIGYHAVCNEIVYFQPEVLQMGKGAITKTALGDERPMTTADVEKVLAMGFRLKDGRVRASASRFVPGKPIGPFKYEDTRSDDPNDVVPHEDRRELRAGHLPAAWINHVDAREQNTFDVVIDESGKRFIRHYKIDWGDSLGIGFNPDRLARRLGYSYAIDLEQIGVDLFTIGLLHRPWHDTHRTKVQIFGYYGVEGFVPSEWRGVYSIPAFARRTPADILWMTRIFSRITDDHIRAIVARAQLPDPRQSHYLEHALIGRRNKFFEEYLTEYVPLANFRLARRTSGSGDQSLCFEDLGIVHGVARANETYYQFRFRAGNALDQELGWVQFMPDERHPAWACVRLPLGQHRPSDLAGPNAKDDDPLRYGVMDLWVHQKPTVLPMGQVRLHFYDLGPE
ncbi:MAG TPA: hypothetical protein VLC09_02425, partial [Polyangiaceae bacterium]|nr:hypothetical protein [Polyangiaceae bacterium]